MLYLGAAPRGSTSTYKGSDLLAVIAGPCPHKPEQRPEKGTKSTLKFADDTKHTVNTLEGRAAAERSLRGLEERANGDLRKPSQDTREALSTRGTIAPCRLGTDGLESSSAAKVLGATVNLEELRTPARTVTSLHGQRVEGDACSLSSACANHV